MNYVCREFTFLFLKVLLRPGGKNESGAESAETSWDFEKWVIAEQEANPHCYGIVDPETLPPECFGQVAAESPAVKSGVNRVEVSPQAAASDWASGNWTVEGDGWSGWDKSDLRYSDEDRDAARVGVFAANCWGVYEVSRSHGLYELMRERMQRNECPNEETVPASSDYATVPGDSDYLSALSDLEAEEAERLRLEEEERQRQARLKAEERERQTRLEAEDERAKNEQSVMKLLDEMVSVPAGKFRMGSRKSEADDNEKPVHRVTVPAFKLSKHEVTFAQ